MSYIYIYIYIYIYHYISGLMSAAGAADKVFELIDRVPDISVSGDLEPQGPGGVTPSVGAISGNI